MPPVLFICDSQGLEQLTEFSRFQALFHRFSGQDICKLRDSLVEFNDKTTVRARYVLCCDSRIVTVPQKGDREYHKFEELVTAAIGNRICRMVIFHKHETDDDVSKKWHEIVGWAKQFTNIAVQRGGQELRLTLIVIGLEQDRYHALIEIPLNAAFHDGGPEEVLSPVIFYMEHHLTRAEDRLHHAEKVWPQPVSLLLAGLAAGGDPRHDGHRFQDLEGGKTYRWRGIVVAPELGVEQDQALMNNAWDAFRKQIVADADQDVFISENSNADDESGSSQPSPANVEPNEPEQNEYNNLFAFLQKKLMMNLKSRFGKEIDGINKAWEDWRDFELFSDKSTTSPVDPDDKTSLRERIWIHIKWACSIENYTGWWKGQAKIDLGRPASMPRDYRRVDFDRLLIKDPNPIKEADQLFWKIAGENPAMIFQKDKESIWMQMAGMQGPASVGLDKMQEISNGEMAISKLQKDAEDAEYELALARYCYITVWERMWEAMKAIGKSACIVVILLGFVFALSLWFGVGCLVSPVFLLSWFAVIPAMGAVLAVLASGILESRAGRRGWRWILAQGEEIRRGDELQKNRCCDMMNNAFRSWRSNRRVLMSLRSRYLAQRAKNLLLFHLPKKEEEDDASREGGRLLRTPSPDFLIYAEGTTCYVPLNNASRNNIETLILKKMMEDFRQRWKRFCDDHDCHAAGNLPGKEMVLMISGFRTDWSDENFRNRVMIELLNGEEYRSVNKEGLETIGKEITDMLGLDDGRFFSVYDEASGRTHLLGSFFFANKLTFSSSGSTALPHPDRGVSTGYAIVQGLNCDLPLLGFCLDVDKWNSMPSRQKKMDVS